MAAVPTVMYGMFYPPGKGQKPFMATFKGVVWNPDLGIGGGPILPPDEVPPVDPPLGIWGGPIDPYPDIGLPGPQPHPEHPIVLPPDPPTKPPDPPVSTQPVKPNAWNFNDGSNPTYPTAGWYYVHVPGPGQPQPKRR